MRARTILPPNIADRSIQGDIELAVLNLVGPFKPVFQGTYGPDGFVAIPGDKRKVRPGSPVFVSDSGDDPHELEIRAAKAYPTEPVTLVYLGER